MITLTKTAENQLVAFQFAFYLTVRILWHNSVRLKIIAVITKPSNYAFSIDHTRAILVYYNKCHANFPSCMCQIIQFLHRIQMSILLMINQLYKISVEKKSSIKWLNFTSAWWSLCVDAGNYSRNKNLYWRSIIKKYSQTASPFCVVFGCNYRLWGESI